MTPAVTLSVLRPGLLTTVQDLGRWGHQALGVPVAGAMDTRSLREANLLVGNPDAAAGLEVTLLGPTLRTDAAITAAMTGADLEVRVDGQRVPVGRVFDLTTRRKVDTVDDLGGFTVTLPPFGGIATLIRE